MLFSQILFHMQMNIFYSKVDIIGWILDLIGFWIHTWKYISHFWTLQLVYFFLSKIQRKIQWYKFWADANNISGVITQNLIDIIILSPLLSMILLSYQALILGNILQFSSNCWISCKRSQSWIIWTLVSDNCFEKINESPIIWPIFLFIAVEHGIFFFP